MKPKTKSSIFSLIVLVVIIGGFITTIMFYNFSKRTVFNIGNVSGNTAGNLYNNGLFCEYNNKIYFSNSYDHGNLYVMDSDATNIHKLYDDTISYINIAGKYIYYARNNLDEETKSSVFRVNLFGIYRINLDGSHLLALNKDACGAVSLGNNKIFFQHYDTKTALSLRSITIDGKTEEKIDSSAINPSCINNGSIYYNNVTKSFNLCTKNVDEDTSQIIYNGAGWHPIFDNSYVYFMDIDNNYSLARVNLATNIKEDLGTGRVDTYNLYGDYIYYQLNDPTDPSLCRMKKDGTDVQKIIDGNFCNINITSNYVFFNQFGNDVPIYKIATSGDLNVTRFDEAAEAIVKE